MTANLQVNFEPVRSIAFGSITGSFVAFGTPFAHPIRIMCITNTTDKDMFFSINGTDIQIVVVAGGFKLFDFSTNSFLNAKDFALPKGTQVYIQYSAAPGSGNVYLEAVY